MNKGLVIKLTGGNYTIENVLTKENLVCKASGKLRYVKVDRNSSFKEKDNDSKVMKISPKVGDFVLFDNNYIEEVCERKNSLKRPDVANIDQVVLVFASKDPEFSFNLLDNFILQIEKESIPIKIVITKIDLLNEKELDELKNKMLYYDKMGYTVYYTSKITRDGIDNASEIFDHKISVLAGQTGAGKSTLLNCLDENFALDTQEISKALGRGKHTTRHTELLKFQNGLIADTPGFSSLEFNDISLDDLRNGFLDFKELSKECKFNSCSHINEPNCNVKNNAEKILKTRYENYVKFYNEIKKIKKY